MFLGRANYRHVSIFFSLESASKSTFGFRATIFTILTLQATCYFTLVGYSRQRDTEMYFSSTVVFMSENVKLLVSLGVIFSKTNTAAEFLPFLWKTTLQDPTEVVKLTVPAFLYTMQNNLLYVAMSHLDVVTFQVSCFVQYWNAHGPTWNPDLIYLKCRVASEL